ncbi:MAG: hypothetical protein ACTSVF_03615, partial [Candidatus Asgardarchaeia archaeon]
QYSIKERVNSKQKEYHSKKSAIRNIEFHLRYAQGETPTDRIDNALNELIMDEEMIEKELKEGGYIADVWCGYVDPLSLKGLREKRKTKGPTMFDPSTTIIVPTEQGIIEISPCKLVLRSDPRGFVNVGFTDIGNIYFRSINVDPFVLKPAIGITIYDPTNDVYDMGIIYEVVE